MSLKRQLSSGVARSVASRSWRLIRHWSAEHGLRPGSGRRVLEFFHQVDDPHSHLALQCLAGLRSAYDVEVVVHLVPPPALTTHPDADTYQAWARRDAADVAPDYGLHFSDPGGQPAPELVSLARCILSAALKRPLLPEVALAVGTALWRDEASELEALAAQHGADPEDLARSREAAGGERRRRLGHYGAAMFHFCGDWYWGVDRLPLLEARLAALGASLGATPPLLSRPALQWPSRRAAAAEIRVECFVSVRSPYSAIVMRRLLDWVDATGVRLQLRPVLPMVMRGVALSRTKGFYILADAAREADRVGARFGWFVDPIGEPAERALSLFPWAESKGRGDRYLLSCLEGAWADGIDLGSDRGLSRAVTRCNLSWSDARAWLGRGDWRQTIEANRLALCDLGLWGVPSFRVSGPDAEAGTWSTWGQDRLWRVTREVTRRAHLLGTA